MYLQTSSNSSHGKRAMRSSLLGMLVGISLGWQMQRVWQDWQQQQEQCSSLALSLSSSSKRPHNETTPGAVQVHATTSDETNLIPHNNSEREDHHRVEKQKCDEKSLEQTSESSDSVVAVMESDAIADNSPPSLPASADAADETTTTDTAAAAITSADADTTAAAAAQAQRQDREGQSSPALSQVCQRLFSSSSSSTNEDNSWTSPPSTTTVWADHLEKIAAATRVSGVTADVELWDDKVTALLSLVTPRLVHSVQAVYRDEEVWNHFDRLLLRSVQRYDYLVNPDAFAGDAGDAQAPPPVKIVIMGGSVVGGTSCNAQGLSLGYCAWPNRLNHFLHNLLLPPHVAGGKIFDIQVITMGGTDSEMGEMILNYDLLPQRAKNPDMIIHAYSTNDSNYATLQRAQERKLSYGQHLMDIQESFIRTATRPIQPPHCQQNQQQQQPPLLLYLNDHISTGINGILTSMLFPQVVHAASSYYGFAVASHADMIRDIVYGDNMESIFSPPFYWYSKQRFKYEVHPQPEGHIVLAWVAAYNLLNLVTTRCGQHRQQELLQRFQNQPHRAAAMARLDEILPTRARPKPTGFPPRLIRSSTGEDYLTMETITELWKHEEQQRLAEACPTEQEQQQRQQRCPFSWFYALSSGGVRPKPNPMKWFFMKWKVAIDYGANNAWSFGDNACLDVNCGRNPKYGLVTSGPVGSQVTLTFPVETFAAGQSITKVAIMYMKSYGKTWENSTALLSVVDTENGQVLGSTFADSYFHDDRHASLIVSTEIDFQDHPVQGKALQITANLTSGHTFKIMGIAICQW